MFFRYSNKIMKIFCISVISIYLQTETTCCFYELKIFILFFKISVKILKKMYLKLLTTHKRVELFFPWQTC